MAEQDPKDILPKAGNVASAEELQRVKSDNYAADLAQGIALPSDDSLRQAFAPYHGQIAGIVIIFGHAPQIEQGVAIADIIGYRLKGTLPSMFNASGIASVVKPLGWVDYDPSHLGVVGFSVFFRSNVCR